MKLIFDIETDGFLSRMTRIHSLVIRDVTSDDVDARPAPYIFRWHDEYDAYFTEEGAELGPISMQKALVANPDLVFTTQRMPAENNIREGVEFLMEADELIGHNIAGFDIPGIKKLFPWFAPKGKIRDTLVIARMVAPDIKLSDYNRSLNGTLPGKLIGSQSLDSWGYRLGMNKGDYSNEMLAAGRNPWEGWNIDMEEYCLTPDHRLLGNDLVWRTADSYSVGDTVLGFDEDAPARKYRAAKIQAIKHATAPVFAVTLDNGDVIKTTADHRWLVKGGKPLRHNWVKTKDLKIGARVPKLLNVWDAPTDNSLSWLEGIFDGEGHVSSNARQLSVSQRPGYVLSRIEDSLKALNIAPTKRCVKAGSDCALVAVNGTLSERLEFLGTVRPMRLVSKIDFNQLGRLQAGDKCARVVSVSYVGEREIIKIQTDARTFVADGYPMHNCVLDVAVNEVLWAALLADMPPESALELEHDSHSVGTKMTESGVPFDAAGALVLADEITTRLENLSKDVVDAIGFWYRPKKKYLIRAPYCPEEKIDVEKRKVYPPPRTEWGEDESRAIWAEFQFPKINRKSLKLGDLTIGCPYCPIERVQFNPGSRDHIIDRFTTQYGWQPTEFTDTGKPTVDDTTMKVMAETIPMAKPLADIFFYKKIIGQVQFGTNSWLAKYNEDTGCIHHYLNVGGTVSGRCSHNSPNLGQVPAVVAEKTFNKDGTFNKKILDANGNPYPECFDENGNPRAKTLLLGRQGDYGVESRSLFRVPKIIPQVMVDEAGNFFEIPNEWLQVGVDLSGIELRMLAEACAKYDDGELIEVVLSGDIHEYNMSKTGITNRELIKRGTYACVPMDTQALTRTGWKTYEQLSVGEMVLTYNAANNTKEWKPVLEKVYYDTAPVIEISTGHGFSVRSTPNHRWFVNTRKAGRTKYYVQRVTTTEEITTEDAIIVNAPYVNPNSGDSFTFLDTTKRETDWVPRVLDMTDQELNGFLAGFCIADGYYVKSKDGNKRGRWQWSQNRGNLFEAALLASYLVSDKKIHVSGKVNPLNKRDMAAVKIGVNNNVTGQRLVKTRHPDQPVWCVRTENESWVIRQGNTITITGNTLYGAGFYKLGLTINPLASMNQAIQIGKEFKSTLMRGLPALRQTIEETTADASSGYLIGIDGRKLSVRSPHAALNLRLQSAAGLLAKKWFVLTHDRACEQWDYGWNGDFTQMLFIHDEQQSATKKAIAKDYAALCVQAAADAGKFFNFSIPIAAEAKIGHNWKDTH